MTVDRAQPDATRLEPVQSGALATPRRDENDSELERETRWLVRARELGLSREDAELGPAKLLRKLELGIARVKKIPAYTTLAEIMKPGAEKMLEREIEASGDELRDATIELERMRARKRAAGQPVAARPVDVEPIAKRHRPRTARPSALDLIAALGEVAKSHRGGSLAEKVADQLGRRGQRPHARSVEKWMEDARRMAEKDDCPNDVRELARFWREQTS